MLVRILLKSQNQESMVWADDVGFDLKEIDWKIAKVGILLGRMTMPDGTLKTYSAAYNIGKTKNALILAKLNARRAIVMSLQLAFAESNYRLGVVPSAEQIAGG